ncbi:MAG: hypothetical protein HUJ22_08895 [Gracilimonas sp.]|uniref:hypothetical protein n=1 Tax=Gracilimonas sp. TaxID=1974203 RepID=UPI0019A06136|nr:hypothetical protein [Gracilimonas sp.]MBD3616678.1 hypothetical protein [Gracilimonas sp.]
MKFSTRRFNEWLIVFLLLVLVTATFSFIRGDMYFLPDNLHYIFNMRPSTTIIGINTQDAIEIFRGNAASGYSITWETVSIYLNVVIYLMIGPYLLFKGYKKAQTNDNRAKPWYWYIGGAICIGMLFIVPAEITRMNVFENTKEAADKSRTKDLMRAELAEVGFATAQHEILEDGVNESFTIEDLNLEDLKYEHSVENVQSDTLVMISVSNPEYPDLGHRMEVRPYSQRILRLRN